MKTRDVLSTSESEIDRAIFAFADAYAKLWKCSDLYPESLPRIVIGSGLIAEHYSFIYLRHKHPKCVIKYSRGSQRAWDLEVIEGASLATRYQVKSVSAFNKSRITGPIVRGFDRLIVIFLDGNFFPLRVHQFNSSSALAPNQRLTVPDPTNHRRRGSSEFSVALDITNAFHQSLE